MNPSTELTTTTEMMIPASTHSFSINFVKPAAIRTRMRTLLTSEKTLASALRFLLSGRRFGPYFWSRAEASDTLRPVSALVPSCVTTSVGGRACQAATSLTVFVVIVAPHLRADSWDRLARTLGAFALSEEHTGSQVAGRIVVHDSPRIYATRSPA